MQDDPEKELAGILGGILNEKNNTRQYWLREWFTAWVNNDLERVKHLVSVIDKLPDHDRDIVHYIVNEIHAALTGK